MAGMNQREIKAVAKDETIKYQNPDDFVEWYPIYINIDDVEPIDRLRYVEGLIAHFERSKYEVNSDVCKEIFEQTLADIEEATSGGDDAFTLPNIINLVYLSTLALCELDDQPPAVFHEWTSKIFKWLGRERELYDDSTSVDKICSCIAAVEASFRPVPEGMSIYPQLSKIIDKTSEADSRGFLIRLAACTIQDKEEERESLASLINDAIASPAEHLIIHGIRAAAIFLDRFGEDNGLDSELLEADIPSTGQRECGVSKANIDRECRDVWDFVRADEDEATVPRNPIVEDIDHVVVGFAGQELLRNLQRAFSGTVTNNFQRTRNGVFRISQRALGYTKQHRDRAYGKGKFQEQLEREQQQKQNDKERSAARKLREKELHFNGDE